MVRWYLTSLALILCVFGTALYVTVSFSLQRDVDRGLALQAQGLADSIFSFWRAERAAALSGPGNWDASPASTFRDDVDQGRLNDVLARWSQKTRQLEDELPVQLLNVTGQPLGESPSFTQLALPIRHYLLKEAVAGRTVFTTVRTDAHRTRIVAHPVKDGGRVLYVVQVASILDPVYASLTWLRVWLVLLILITLGVASSTGWFLARTAMRPVERMTLQARQISIGRLHERVDVPQTKDELERLGVTFNDMLARLEDAFKRMRQFSAAASHELRTPLTVMKGELEVALRRPRDLDEYQRVLRTHLDAIDEMTHTVEELLLLARSESVDGAIEWRPVEFGALIRRIGQTWKPLAKAKRIDLSVDVSAPVWVRGEQRLLERLLANLVDNALRHTPAQGRIVLRLASHANDAVLSAQDTGSGIPAQELPQIFDRFFKPRVQTANSSTGLGLGLCRWIVETHHGRIEIASPPGKGVTVTVRLPRIPAPSASA